MRIRRSGFILLGLPLLVLAGCAAPLHPPTASGPAIDRARAMARLDRIMPIPRFPAAPAEPAPPPSAAGQRYFKKGREHYEQQLWMEAISSLERALQSDPRYVDARVLLARACVQNGNSGLAVNHLQEALRDRPRDPAIHQLLGEISWQENRTGEAIAELRLALLASEDQPKLPERILAELSLAMALRKEGYLSAAVDQLESYLAAVHQPTEEMRGHRELGETMTLYRGKAAGLIAEIQTELGRPDLAAEAYARASAESPEDAALRVRWARCLASAGRTDAALAVAEKLLADFPEEPSGLPLLRDLCDASGRKEQYDRELARLARTTKKTGHRMELIELLRQRGRSDEAIGILRELPCSAAADAKARLLLARLCFERGRWEEGLSALVDALRADPPTYRQVEALLRGVHEDAARRGLDETSRRLVEAQPGGAEAGCIRAVLLASVGRGADAERGLRAVLEGHERFGPAWALLARQLANEKKWEQAVEACDSAAQAGVRDGALYLLKGESLAALAEYDEAETALMESFELDRKSPEALYVLAELADRRNDRRRCELLYRRILNEVDPRHAPSREKLVRLYIYLGRRQQAGEYLADFERLKIEGPAAERCRALFELLEGKSPPNENRLKKYRARLDRLAAGHPNDATTLMDLALSHVVDPDLSRAMEYVDKALVVDPGNTAARELKASLQTKLLDFAGAERIFRGLLADRPRDPGYQRNLLDLALHEGDFGAAIERIRPVLAAEKEGEVRDQLHSQLIFFMVRLERFDEAIAEAKKWLAEAPKEAKRRSMLLAALDGSKRFDQAVEAARGWLAEEPTSEELRAQYIEQLRLAGNILEAQQKVLAWLEHEPDDIGLNIMLIRLFWAAKEWDQAVETAQTGAELSSGRARYENLLGQTYVFAKRYDEALKFYQAQAKNHPSPAAFRDWLSVLMAAERYEDAEKVIAPLLAGQLARRDARETFDAPLVIELRRRLASIYQQTGRDGRAIQQLEEVLALVPDDAGTNNDLGYTLADRGERLDEAERMIRLAVGKLPRESAYLDSLGWVLYKRGRFAESVVLLERAIRLRDGDDAVYHDHLGDALYRAGQVDRAKAEWEKARAALGDSGDEPPVGEYKRVRQATAAKLKQLADGAPATVAPLASGAPTSRAADPGAATGG